MSPLPCTPKAMRVNERGIKVQSVLDLGSSEGKQLASRFG